MYIRSVFTSWGILMHGPLCVKIDVLYPCQNAICIQENISHDDRTRKTVYIEERSDWCQNNIWGSSKFCALSSGKNASHMACCHFLLKLAELGWQELSTVSARYCIDKSTEMPQDTTISRCRRIRRFFGHTRLLDTRKWKKDCPYW